MPIWWRTCSSSPAPSGAAPWCDPERRPLAPLVREIVERFAPLAGTAAVRLRTELDETLLAPVDADAAHQILLNLLDNAVKHGGDRGAVILRLGLHEALARIEVEDGGPGVPAAMRERIWDTVRPPRPAPLGAGQRDRARGGPRAGSRARRRMPGGAAARRAGRGSWSSCPAPARAPLVAPDSAPVEAPWPAS